MGRIERKIVYVLELSPNEIGLMSEILAEITSESVHLIKWEGRMEEIVRLKELLSQRHLMLNG